MDKTWCFSSCPIYTEKNIGVFTKDVQSFDYLTFIIEMVIGNGNWMVISKVLCIIWCKPNMKRVYSRKSKLCSKLVQYFCRTKVSVLGIKIGVLGWEKYAMGSTFFGRCYSQIYNTIKRYFTARTKLMVVTV